MYTNQNYDFCFSLQVQNSNKAAQGKSEILSTINIEI